ncbi:MAG: hypothetical protein BroJett021_09180 [Chloroflexota bacterium]|nr:MAG: hypothetical protein BroJett021_09180 [Chloroflexota bacterium]
MTECVSPKQIVLNLFYPQITQIAQIELLFFLRNLRNLRINSYNRGLSASDCG